MDRKESYKRIRETKDDDFEDRLLKRELYKSMIMRDNKNFVESFKTPTGKVIRLLSIIIIILLVLLILK